MKGAGSDVGLDVQIPVAQTANALQITKPDGTVVSYFDKSGNVGFNAGAYLFESAANAVVPYNGGGQTSATPLNTQTAAVTTSVATTAPFDSLMLPTSVAGLELLIINASANAIQIFGASTDTIDGVATATGVTQMAHSLVIYSCPVAGLWYSEGLATGYGGSGLQTLSYTPAITAHSGGTQAAAVNLTSMINRVSVVAAQGDSVALPASAIGLEITVINRGANPCQVYGNNTAADTINGIATGTGISQGINTAAVYICNVAGNWEVPINSLVSSTPQALSVNGAIPAHVGHTYVITKAGVLAETLAAPTATTDDGIEITVTSSTANAHTITATGLLATGTASVNVATFAAFAGAGLTLMAYQGKWNVIAQIGITFS